MRAMVAAAIGLSVAWGAVGQPTPTHGGVAYATIGGRQALLDLYIPGAGAPGAPGPWPVVVWIHGGGWAGGSRFPAGFAQPLMQRGIAVASIDYRLTSEAGQWGSEGVTFPAQIHDCKGAVRWLRANAAAYNLDHTRVGVWGSSAGGHLAALVGTSGGAGALEGTVGGNLEMWSGVQAVADYFGPTDLLNMQLDVTTPPGSVINHDDPGSPESRLIGFDGPGEGIGVLRANQTNPAAPFPFYMTLVTQANPITWVGAGDPPMFIAHGDSDVVVPWRQSERLRNALNGAGVWNEYRLVSGAGHGNLGAATTDGTLVFFEQRLRALARCAGDATGDRRVDFADLNVVLTRFGQSGPAVPGDLNRDGVVNFADLNEALGRFGTAC